MARGTSAKTHPPLKIRFFKRMKTQKVYTVQVAWKSPPSKAKGGEPYTVRMIVPGAQVVPSERILSPGKPKDKAVFYVTPLAKRGQLRGERLEVLQDGEKIQEVAIPAKVSSLKWVWIFLLLAILTPWVLTQYVQTQEPIEYGQGYDNMIYSTDTFFGKDVPVSAVGWETETPLTTAIPEDAITWGRALYVNIEYALIEDSDGMGHRLNIPIWCCVGFLVLAFLAWWRGREKRSTRVSKPLAIG